MFSTKHLVLKSQDTGPALSSSLCAYGPEKLKRNRLYALNSPSWVKHPGLWFPCSFRKGRMWEQKMWVLNQLQPSEKNVYRMGLRFGNLDRPRLGQISSFNLRLQEINTGKYVCALGNNRNCGWLSFKFQKISSNHTLCYFLLWHKEK